MLARLLKQFFYNNQNLPSVKGKYESKNDQNETGLPVRMMTKIVTHFDSLSRKDFPDEQDKQKDELNKKLVEAALKGNLTEVKSAIEKGADVNVADYITGYSLLMHLAANKTNNTEEIAKYLIEKGANVNYVSSKTFEKLTALSVALDPYDRNEYFSADRLNEPNWQIVKLLLENGASTTRNMYEHLMPYLRFFGNDKEQSIIRSFLSTRKPSQSDNPLIKHHEINSNNFFMINQLQKIIESELARRKNNNNKENIQQLEIDISYLKKASEDIKTEMNKTSSNRIW